MTISTNATLSDLRPKVMMALYAPHKVYLLGPRDYGQPGDVYHLVHTVADWASLPDAFGHEIAYFQPHDLRPGWFRGSEFYSDKRITLKRLSELIGKGEVCTLGKDCPKHK